MRTLENPTRTVSATILGLAASVVVEFIPGDEGRCWGNPETAYQGWDAELVNFVATFEDGTVLDADAVSVWMGDEDAFDALAAALVASAEEAVAADLAAYQARYSAPRASL